MKKNYVSPNIEIIEFFSCDVIKTSGTKNQFGLNGWTDDETGEWVYDK